MEHDDESVESILKRYRLSGPPADLRARVLAAVARPPAPPQRRHVAVWAAAAALLICFGLEWMAYRVNRQTAAMIGVGQARWTADAEEAARLLGDRPSDRQYIGFLLTVGQDLDRAGAAPGLGFSMGDIS